MSHRLYLLGLMVLTVVGAGAASPTLYAPESAAVAACLALAGILVFLWACWLHADRRRP